jgi:hypothetical protein
MRTYDGPVSDHFDGMRFFDPDGVPPKSLADVLRWQFGRGRQRQAWPEWAPSPHADVPPARVGGDKVRLSFVGHASWLIQTSGLNILIDPIWSPRASPVHWAGPKRHNDPGIAFDALPVIDVALVSHGHYDHLDLATLSKLHAKFSPRVVTALGNDVTMRSADAAIKAEAFDADCSTATRRCGPVLSSRHRRARSTSSAIPATARAGISATSGKRMVRCGWLSCRSAPMSRAGS